MSKTIKLRPFQQAFIDQMNITPLVLSHDAGKSVRNMQQVVDRAIDKSLQKIIWLNWCNVDQQMQSGKLPDETIKEQIDGIRQLRKANKMSKTIRHL